MEIPPDIKQYVSLNFDHTEVADAVRLLEGATLHDGHSPDDRMLRCALSASDNSLKSLEYQVAGLAIDYRDVILAGEYVREKGEFIRLRDLSEPFNFDTD